MNRLAAMQLWPLFCIRAATPAATAASRSASARTTNGSDPPSSSTTGLSAAPASAATARPARSEPVSVTAATRSSAMTAATRASVMGRCSKVPSPAPAKASARASPQPRTVGACFSRTVPPARTTGTAARTACQYGKFHGMMARTVPSGS